MSITVEIIICAFLLMGGLFVLLGSFGLLRLPDFYTRLHAPTKATTLGLAGLLIGSMIYFFVAEQRLVVHELLITLFLLITAPVSAHMMAKSALHHRVKMVKHTQGQQLANTARKRQPPPSDGA
ncbi:Na(+) H(+) antiporter subunit G [Marinobacterium lacunae]|uniref:Na(+) H(+) antiporter subunit G n=1 Tax=Marinobacterium lacunae TaxID=1232683 RepID=A0A081G0F0_9GAMM|nr:Na+/H+ antiporter subunit G [Marinobacterium lacunae]KEA64255.1 Na(+) H(+) antiporter subunit G [Marinobacterium lacunae]